MKKDIFDPVVTVFTPTFNRAYCLNRVFESLVNQTFRSFEWLIVDDGSTDETKLLIENFSKKCDFSIRYIYQNNCGKHNAINKGVCEAKGAFFIIADSDDSFKPETLEVFLQNYNEVPNKESFAGIWCLVEDERGLIVGDRFPQDIWDCGVKEYYFKNNIKGEKWQMIRTEVLKKFPMPSIEIKGLYVGESIMWMAISKSYRFRCINVSLRKYYTSVDGIMQTNHKNDSVKWYGYYLQFHYLYKEFAEYFNLSPIFYLKGMVLYQYAIYRLNISLFQEFKSISGIILKFFYIILLTLLPVVVLYKQCLQLAKK